MAKRNANTELNHDNWNEEEEPQEAGVFVQADNKTMEGRVIKKAKRCGIKNVRFFYNKLMPRPSTRPKIFWDGPNVWYQTKHSLT